MKIQLDTKAKTIKFEEDVKLATLLTTVKKLLPNDEWKEFVLITNTKIEYWTSPIIYKEIIKEVEPYRWPEYPWYDVTWSDSRNKVTYEASSVKKDADYSLKAGVFNVEA